MAKRDEGAADDHPRDPAALLPRGSVRLERTRVYRRLPVAVRARLNEAILLRPKGLGSLEAIASHLELAHYGISLAALRTYARQLEELVRPAANAQLMGSLLGCLPESFRRQLIAGSEVLLLSRVLRALNAEGEHALTVAELARLASIVTALAGKTARSRPTPHRSKKNKDGGPEDRDGNPSSETGLAAAVRTLYGLSWPPDDRTSDNDTPDARAAMKSPPNTHDTDSQ